MANLYQSLIEPILFQTFIMTRMRKMFYLISFHFDKIILNLDEKNLRKWLHLYFSLTVLHVQFPFVQQTHCLLPACTMITEIKVLLLQPMCIQ